MHPWQKAAPEPPVTPEIPIIDPHHHFWKPGEAGAEMFGRFLPEDFAAEIAKSGHGFAATVFAGCFCSYRDFGPEELRCVGETEFVDAAAQRHPGLAAGIIGQADFLLGEAVAEVFAAHMEASPTRFRGVRGLLASDPDVHNGMHTPPGLSRDPRFRSGYAQLERFGLSFDAFVYHHQLGEIADLAGAFPNIPVIVNHLGGPVLTGSYAARREDAITEWKAGLTALAQHPNVTLKLSGLGMESFGFTWPATPPDSTTMADAFRPLILPAIDIFSPSRCMFASNFPVDGLAFGYGALWNAFKRIAAGFSLEEQHDLLHGTAARIYKLKI